MRSCALGACLTAALAAGSMLVPNVNAQSVLDHPPDVMGTWTGVSATPYFDVVHRFKATGGSSSKVLNSPTFLLGARGAIVGRLWTSPSTRGISVLI